jgi:hypothetical protein
VPSWSIHKKWDLKLGIPFEVSDYIQKAIDSKGSSDKKIPMPEDFKQHTEDRKLQRSRGKNFAIADLNSNLHDRAKDKVIQAEDLKFLLNKGTDYVKSYYLHFILDYLDHPTIREWLKITGESIADCIDKYHKNKAILLPETKEHLVYVIAFLKGHSQEVKEDLGI